MGAVKDIRGIRTRDRATRAKEDAKLRMGAGQATGSSGAGPKIMQGAIGTSLLSEQTFPSPFGTGR